jgi:cytoskeletal protein CcmA (bactofilin family)
MRAVVVAVLGIAVVVPAAVRAATFRSGDEVLIPAGETIADDLYVAGSRVRIEGTVTGDLIAAAGELDLRGPVGGDLLAAGGNVRIDGTVAGTARVGAGDVSLAGAVGDDLVAAAGHVIVGPGGRVGRDLVVGTGNAEARGAVGRNAWLAAREAVVAGPVAGDVRAEVETIAVDAGARIGGRLDVASADEPRIAPDAVIAGGVTRTAREHARPSPAAAWVFRFLRALVAFAALGLLLFAITRAGTARAVDATGDAPLRDLAIGLAFGIAGPIACVLVFLLGLFAGGWWIGLLLFAGYGAVLACGIPVVAAAIGRFVLARLRPGAGPIAALLFGAGVLALLASIPVAGAAIVALAALVGGGAWIVVFATARTRHLPPAAVPTAAAPPAGTPPGPLPA